MGWMKRGAQCGQQDCQSCPDSPACGLRAGLFFQGVNVILNGLTRFSQAPSPADVLGKATPALLARKVSSSRAARKSA